MMISTFGTPPFSPANVHSPILLTWACTHARKYTVPIPRHWKLHISEHAAAQPSWGLPPDMEATLHDTIHVRHGSKRDVPCAGHERAGHGYAWGI
jgi:hypothetical protein